MVNVVLFLPSLPHESLVSHGHTNRHSIKFSFFNMFTSLQKIVPTLPFDITVLGIDPRHPTDTSYSILCDIAGETTSRNIIVEDDIIDNMFGQLSYDELLNMMCDNTYTVILEGNYTMSLTST